VIIVDSPKKVIPTEEAKSLSGETNVAVYISFLLCFILTDCLYAMQHCATRKKRKMQCEDSMESRMLMDVMKELREEGRPISIGRLFAITVNTTEVHVFFLLLWPLNKFLRFI